MQFSYELLNISIKHRLYLILQHYLFRSTHFHHQSLIVYSPQEGQSLKFLLFGAYLLIVDCSSTQDLTICHLTNFFYFRNYHTHPYFMVMLQFSQFYEFPAIQVVLDRSYLSLHTNFSICLLFRTIHLMTKVTSVLVLSNKVLNLLYKILKLWQTLII